MTLRELAKQLDAFIPYETPQLDSGNFKYVFAGDLMSDVLAMVSHDNEKTILVTGLCNPQTLRTAEMLDISVIIMVRGKLLTDDLIDNAQDNGIQIMSTKYSMYQAAGIIYDTRHFEGF